MKTAHESVTVGAGGTADSRATTPGKGYRSNVWRVAYWAVFHLSRDFQRDQHHSVCHWPGIRPGFYSSFQKAVRRQLETRFKLESGGLAESIPIVACMLDPRFKHLQFIPESMREDASDHLNRLLRDEREPPVATGRSSELGQH